MFTSFGFYDSVHVTGMLFFFPQLHKSDEQKANSKFGNTNCIPTTYMIHFFVLTTLLIKNLNGQDACIHFRPSIDPYLSTIAFSLLLNWLKRTNLCLLQCYSLLLTFKTQTALYVYFCLNHVINFLLPIF